MILDHAPRPGPLYWDYRCLECSRPVVVHGNWWQRWRYRRTLSTLGAPPEHLFSVPSQHPCGCVTAYYEQGDQYVYLGVCREHPDQPKWKKTRKVIR